MNDQTENLLEELINKHNFVVKVSTDPDDSLCIMVDFAGQKQCYYRVITDEEGEIYGISYWSSLMITDGYEEFLPLNPAAIRTYIVCDIFRQCRLLDLSYDIIRFFLPSGERAEFTDLLNIPMGENDVNVEKFLEINMSLLLNGEAEEVEICKVMEEKGLTHSFNILRSTLL